MHYILYFTRKHQKQLLFSHRGPNDPNPQGEKIKREKEKKSIRKTREKSNQYIEAAIN